MVQIAYILLCHKDPEAVVDQARRLVAGGDAVAIHFDRRADRADWRHIRAALADVPRVTFARRRLRCGWGEWSLVEATLESLRAAVSAFPEATHFYMLSGDCMPIKSAVYIHRYLAERDADHIESFDFFASDWIKTGLREERLLYRHVFNERGARRLFYAALAAQKRLGLRRAPPRDLQVMIGSQWWCLRRGTVQAILAFCGARRDVLRFFRTTWIPDETFFQTLVRHLVPEAEIASRTLTFLMFSDYGMPVTFHDDHHDLLLAQDYLFARKISPEARTLGPRLWALHAGGRTEFAISNEGMALFRFLTRQGREGRRFAPRFWEGGAADAAERELLVVVCKKWHVAKRLAARIAERTDIPALAYLFNEDSCPLPDLGGIESGMAKRHRHRRALIAMLFEHFGGARLMICVDPANLDLLEDLQADPCRVRILEVECRLSDAFLAGHARRIGLAGAATPEARLGALLPSLRNDIAHESARIRAACLPVHLRLRESDTVEARGAALSAFLSVPSELAQPIAACETLFAD